MKALLTVLLAAGSLGLPATKFPSSAGGTVSLAEETPKHRYTVVVFFSPDCPVMRSHDETLKSLAKELEGRDVAFLAVHSQAESSPTDDAAQAKARAYPFPLLSDPDGVVADALKVRFSTTAVVLDAEGRVHYRGGIDSDHARVTGAATPHLRRALEALLRGREPELAETKALGCVLRRH